MRNQEGGERKYSEEIGVRSEKLRFSGLKKEKLRER